jgi:hypothetical protein
VGREFGIEIELAALRPAEATSLEREAQASAV